MLYVFLKHFLIHRISAHEQHIMILRNIKKNKKMLRMMIAVSLEEAMIQYINVVYIYVYGVVNYTRHNGVSDTN